MGRTFRNYREEEDSSYSRTKKNTRHARNEPGRGMRILNEYDLDDDFDDNLDHEYDVNTTTHFDTRRK